MHPAADEVCEVIITAPDPDWLVEFTRRLVIDRLCASGHNFQPIRTIYRWQGQVHDKTEGRVALRTRRALLPQIVDRAKREHPYEVPSVVAIPIIDGGPDYLDWILEQTEQPAPGALSACHGVHRPPGPRAGQTARPGNPGGMHHDRAERELRRQPHRRPGAAAHRERHRP